MGHVAHMLRGVTPDRKANASSAVMYSGGIRNHSLPPEHATMDQEETDPSEALDPQRLCSSELLRVTVAPFPSKALQRLDPEYSFRPEGSTNGKH